MISKELFCKIIQDIQDQNELDEKLTKLLVAPESHGYIATGEKIMLDLIDLMEELLDDKYEYIDWWLLDTSKGRRKVSEVVNCGAQERVYNLEELESLYYYILGEYDKVPSKLIPHDKNKDMQQKVVDSVTIEDVLRMWDGK